jgi:Tn3 transposase DDE domain
MSRCAANSMHCLRTAATDRRCWACVPIPVASASRASSTRSTSSSACGHWLCRPTFCARVLRPRSSGIGRAATENPWELRRHPEAIRLPLLVFYCVPRRAELIDGLIELLLQITHRITVRAERRVTAEILTDFQQVRGKAGILFRIAVAALDNPDGAVRDVIFPVADEQTFQSLVKEQRAGATYQQRIHTIFRSSYSSHYRRMLPKLLDVLEFRSNNAVYRPLIDALEVIQREQETGQLYFALSAVTVDGVIRPKWRDLVIEDVSDGSQRVNRINYEICVLQSLRERLRSKEVWVAGADRYRNPDDDLPTDFAQRRVACYARLGLPLDALTFIAQLQAEMSAALEQLDRRLPRNPGVRLDPRRQHNPIIVSPLEAQPEPPNLDALKAELSRRWSMTGLLDIVKEADLRIGFTQAFTTAASREAIDRREVQRRLLLCLYGLGTNAGLKRLSGGHHGISYQELLYRRRRYLNEENMREAIRRIVDATLAARRADIWGEGTSACAADSKKFGAWDQNLMTEWHIRYGGRGVMIYWHVERKSVCIYSQLKRCSSSEVASMIEGYCGTIRSWRSIGSTSIATARARLPSRFADCWASRYCRASKQFRHRSCICRRPKRARVIRIWRQFCVERSTGT